MSGLLQTDPLMADFGYDISDHTDVDPLFGTLATFTACSEAHRRGMRIIVDWVPEPYLRPAPVVRRVGRPSRARRTDHSVRSP